MGEGCPLQTISSELRLRGQPSATTESVLDAQLRQVEAVLGDGRGDATGFGDDVNTGGALVLARSVEDS